YYYSIDETGMSHVYSFFLASALIYFFRKTNYFVQTSFSSLILAGFMVGLVIAIRPTNALLILAIALLDLKNKNELITRFKILLKKWVPITIGITVAFVPQLIYSYYAYGALFHYSYTNEAFDFSTPQLIKFWFAPRNGLIPYTPIFLLMLIMIVIMIKKKMQNSWLLLTFFLVMS